MIPQLNQTVYFEANNTVCTGTICNIKPEFQIANIWTNNTSYSKKYNDIYETKVKLIDTITSKKQTYKACIKNTSDLIQCICDNAAVITGNKSDYALMLAIQERSEELTGNRVKLRS